MLLCCLDGFGNRAAAARGRPAFRGAGRQDHAFGALDRAGFELEGEQAVALIGAGQGQSAGRRRGDGAVVLLGDAPYYARFGFSAAATGALTLPGPFERDRLLALELREGALADAAGMILPTGAADGWSRSRGRRAVAKAA